MATENMPAATMTEHPDIVAMSARYERMAETPAAQATEGSIVLAGLFVAVSPWIVGFADTPLAISNLIVGLAIAGLGASYAAAFDRTHRLIWVCPLLGAWTIIAVWTMSGIEATTGMILSNVIAGAAAVVLGVAALAPMYTVRRSARS